VGFGPVDAKKSGSDFAINLPSSAPKNKLIGWYVRAYDGAEWSPWSHDGAATTCALIYDTWCLPVPR